MKLHLVDGTYELFRQFYGRPGTIGPDGMEIGAVRGMLTTLLSLLGEEQVTHVAIAFDQVIESFRNNLFAGYKTGEGIDPALWNQQPLAMEAAAALGLVVWPMVEFETDDALASAAHQLFSHFDQVVICSPDKDFAQCVVGDRVVMRDRRRGLTIDERGVFEKWGVVPSSIPDWLALVGDSADGIPGIPRWGAKSAATVLAHYGHIDSIPDDPSRWSVKVRGAAKLAANLMEQREEALLYKKLATLVLDVDLNCGPRELEWRGADRPRLEALCHRIGDEGLMKQVPRFRF